MDTPREHSEQRPEYNGRTIDTVSQRLHNGHYNANLLIQLHDAQMEMEYKAAHFHNYGEDVILAENVIANEVAAMHFDEQGPQAQWDTVPYMPRQRQNLLRKTATLLLNGRGIIPDYNVTIDDCISKYNALEKQMPSGEDEKPELLTYEDIMNDLAEIRGTAQENRHKRSFLMRSLGRVSSFGANLRRNRNQK